MLPHQRPANGHCVLPQVEEAIFRAHFEPGRITNRQFARAIFQADMARSHVLLEPQAYAPLEILEAALLRDRNDAELELACKTWKAGTMTREDLLSHLRNQDSAPLSVAASAASVARSVVPPQTPRPPSPSPPPPPAAAPELDDDLQELLAEWLGEEEQEKEKEAEDEDEDEEDEGHAKASTLPWRTKIQRWEPAEAYRWAYTVWLRINGAAAMGRHYAQTRRHDKVLARKVSLFVEAHLECARYIDALADPRDVNVDVAHLCSLYRPLGPSHFAADRRLAVRELRPPTKLRPTHLEVIEAAYPGDAGWRVEVVASWIKQGLMAHQLERALLEPDGTHEWLPFAAEQAMSGATHSLFLATTMVANRCMRALIQCRNRQTPLMHAIWCYYVSFTDFYRVCLEHGRADDGFLLYPLGTRVCERSGQLILGDGPSLWTLHGGSTTGGERTFDANDLPDLMHMIDNIPLWGKLYTPNFALGHIYQKALPIVCQGRHLIRLVAKTLNTSPAFVPVFSKLCWVMFADLYPGRLASQDQHLNMRDLLQLRHLTGTRDMLLKTMTESDTEAGGPLIMQTVFRLHIFHMARSDAEYTAQVCSCRDWRYQEEEARKLAELIRSHRYFDQPDTFAHARAAIGRTSPESESTKGHHVQVYRMPRTNMPVKLSFQLTSMFKARHLTDAYACTHDRRILQAIASGKAAVEEFERTFLCKRLKEDGVYESQGVAEIIQPALEMCMRARQFHSSHIDCVPKSAILNALLKIPVHLRMTRDAFAILTHPKYGGATARLVDDMAQLVDIYHCKRGVPKEYERCILAMNSRDAVLATYYMAMTAQLDRISFIELDADTVARTDAALIHVRHRLAPTQTVHSGDLYDVYVSLCCKRVCTMMGRGRFGNRKVALDMERGRFVCTYGVALNTDKSAANTSMDHTTATHTASTLKRGKKHDDNDSDEEEANPITQNPEEDEADVNELRALVPDSILQDGAQPKRGRKRGRKAKAPAKEAEPKKTKVLTPEDEMHKQIRNDCKQFTAVPCGQAVIRFNLRGRALVWRITAHESVRIQHCPQCGALHQHTFVGYVGSPTGLYRCGECAAAELYDEPYIVCAYCSDPVTPAAAEECSLTVRCTLTDPQHELGQRELHNLLLAPERGLQRLVFCSGHYALASRLNRGELMTKQRMWELIEKGERARAAAGKRTVHAK